MEFGVLGPLQVRSDTRPVQVGAPMQRALLAALLLHANQVVPAEQLIDYLWDQTPPPSARTTLQNYILRLRRLLPGRPERAAGQLLVTRAPGYLIQLRPGELDLDRFQGLVADARTCTTQGQIQRAASLLRDALALWRGPPLCDVASETLRRLHLPRLEDQRLGALEARIDAELGLGLHDELTGELHGLVEEQPLRERFRAQLMLALYRCGRQAEALEVYRSTWRLLHDELGIQPGPDLRRLEHAILGEDPSLDLPASVAAGRPPAAAVSPPYQLPPAISGFTGRRQHLDELDRLLGSEADTTAVVISAIDGTAGVGKTALAVHWAHRVRNRFPDGQLYVNLRGIETNPVDPADTLAEFLRALGVTGSSIPVGLEERARLYRTRLADRRVLVVLDNASDEAQVRPLLPGTSSCTVLATSRASLAGLEGVASLTLDPLAPAEALALLATIAGAKRVEAEPEAAAAIIERCGHLPLAVRIAGARLAAKRHWRLSYLAERLSGRRRLHELKVGDLDVAASIALSYVGLSQPERRAFHLLAVLDAPDFPGWVAGAVLDTNFAEAEQRIERLVDAHLLEVAGGDSDGGCRYRFHDLVRDFARVRLQQGSHAGGDAALERALAAYLTVAERARMALEPGGLRTFCRPDTPRWDVDSPDILESVEHRPLDWFAVERRSLLAAIEQAHSWGLWTACWQLAGTLAWLFSMRSEFDTWQRTHELALDAARRDQDRHAEASILQSLATAVFMQDQDRVDYEIASYRQAVAIFEDLGDALWKAYTESWLGDVLWSMGRLEETEILYRQAIAAFRDHGDRRWEALTLRGLGVVHRDQARLSDAARCFGEAAAIFQDLNDAFWQGFTLQNLGQIHGLQGRHDEAIARYQQALISSGRFGDRHAQAGTLIKLGDAYRQQRRFQDALACLDQSLRTYDDLGDSWGAANARRGLANVYRELERWDDAATQLEYCLAVAHQTRDRRAMAFTGHSLGELYRAQGRTAEAITCFNDCLGFFREFGFGLWEAKTLRSLGAALLATGDTAAARTVLRAAVKILRDCQAAEAEEVALQLHELPPPVDSA